uniref:WD_REPEATS_REGION domain-containing protein n=1 Tax=Caenorhabditis japonica TaxID=281687 RepID=A0A8R1DJW8_CAEJA
MVDEMVMRRAPKPKAVMRQAHDSNIFALEFDLEDRFIYSGERSGSVFKHDIEANQLVYTSDKHNSAEDVFHLHQNPTDNNLLAITRARLITFLDDRDRPNPTVFGGSRGIGKFYSAEFHPETPRLLLVNSRSEGPNVFDLRAPRSPLFRRCEYKGLPTTANHNSAGLDWMAGMWSPSGNQYMSLRNNSQPLYFDMISKRCFILNSERYVNVNTVKSMTFVDDYTVATGSDNWGIHVWKVPRADADSGFLEVPHRGSEKADMVDLVVQKEITVLKGHRSIPNQVRFSPHNQLLVSSGVENCVKLWSDQRLPWSYDVPFTRKKAHEYETSRHREFTREADDRRVLEEALDREGFLEGRSTWEDVFGGNVQTAEDRTTLEQFDTLDGVDHDEDVTDDEDIVFFEGELARIRSIINQHGNNNSNQPLRIAHVNGSFHHFPERRPSFMERLGTFAQNFRRNIDSGSSSNSDSDEEGETFHRFLRVSAPSDSTSSSSTSLISLDEEDWSLTEESEFDEDEDMEVEDIENRNGTGSHDSQNMDNNEEDENEDNSVRNENSLEESNGNDNHEN